ncbi:DUF2726 domain-containing protein [Roseateles saccharophilus]|uniref:Uncharacterized protein DUF2726 n=1 Tax=Roseateles saccharophilus TaxID=304 RepID=A0A4R3VGP2_ROSSA|nr:DUF2726 domain-containing protein [Roseateles saccharophilus]MDG0836246.1 DUF2726 domain-containing protein [Roseateles saccharophilus]TCV02025.1 uncharacterized protein DUF2726 [Roseateles saccharophilus]
MPYAIYWIAALAVCVLGLAIGLVWALRRPAYANRGLPAEWSLTARPVFTTDERRVFRLLREALPHHVVLSKLPLVRFCQPTEAKEVRYWFDLLGASHVTFAVCSPNGRVLAAIDLEGERGVTPRSLQIKHAVLSACRVRYLRCTVDHLPSVAELQLLVPQGSNPRGPLPAPGASATPSLPRRRTGGMGEDEFGSDWGQFSQPLPLWQDANVFNSNDIFGEPRPRMPAQTLQQPMPQRRSMQQRSLDTTRYNPRTLPVLDDADEEAMMDDIVGVVVDAPRYATQRPRRG